MNTIPLTFSENLPSYTAVGGTERKSSTGLSAVILNRGGRYPRLEFLEDMEKAGFDYVLSMESSSPRYDLEDLTRRFPFVRFILLKEAVSPGEEINLAAAELSSPLFFVMRNDMKILRGGTAERMTERLVSGVENSEAESLKPYKRLCTVPLIQDAHAEILPTLIAPVLLPGSAIRTIPSMPDKEAMPSLYPFDGIGIYDSERFIRLGGFDSSIKSFYWQLMDFGFRSSLWGEEIISTQQIKLTYETELPQEDSTVNISCLKFILKNLAPVFRGDYAYIPFSQFPDYLKRRGDFREALKEFRLIRNWVKLNRYRFTTDARTIAERFINYREDNSAPKDHSLTRENP